MKVTKNELITLLGFLLFIFGFLTLIFSFIGVELFFLPLLSLFGTGVTMILSSLMIAGGIVCAYFGTRGYYKS